MTKVGSAHASVAHFICKNESTYDRFIFSRKFLCVRFNGESTAKEILNIERFYYKTKQPATYMFHLFGSFFSTHEMQLFAFFRDFLSLWSSFLSCMCYYGNRLNLFNCTHDKNVDASSAVAFSVVKNSFYVNGKWCAWNFWDGAYQYISLM